MAANDWLAQDLADMLDLPVERPAFVETTALGAAMLAGVGLRLSTPRSTRRRRCAARWRRSSRRWTPATREARLGGWRQALAGVLDG